MPKHIRQVADIATADEAQRLFLDWLFDFDAVDDVELLMSMLINCDELLPDDYANTLDLPAGSTIADAVALLGGPWGIA